MRCLLQASLFLFQQPVFDLRMRTHHKGLNGSKWTKYDITSNEKYVYIIRIIIAIIIIIMMIII